MSDSLVMKEEALWERTGGTLEKAVFFIGTAVACVVIYAGMSALLKSEEMEYFIEIAKKKVQRRTK